jgi:uncharacterized BrkB/YihY/UPF0761 family membrane protein
MNSSDKYARSLRARPAGRWRWRFASVLATLMALLGILLALLGAASLLGRPVHGLDGTMANSSVMLILGLVLLLVGLLFRRASRRRLNTVDDLSLAPHLLKKRG